MASTPACPSGVTSTRASATDRVNTPATRTATASARCTSTPSKASGPCCAPGCGRTGVSRRRSCRFTSASSSSCTTHAVAAKPCLARSLPPWSHDSPDQHPGSQQEPSIIVAAELLRPEPLVRLAAALGKAQTQSAPVLGDEYNPGSLQRQSQSSHLRSHDRDRPIRSFSLGDCGQGDLTALSQLVITPAHQGSRGTKLAPGDEAEII